MYQTYVIVGGELLSTTVEIYLMYQTRKRNDSFAVSTTVEIYLMYQTSKSFVESWQIYNSRNLFNVLDPNVVLLHKFANEIPWYIYCNYTDFEG